MGGRKQNRALGYATSTVKGDELARTNTLSPANALQGKVAGVRISTGGAAGITTAPSVTIRGNKSLSKNNSPIYVIDGIVMQYDQQSAGSYSSISESTQYGNQLKNLNPDDYESVTVLKGAAATSLYGSRGANGAIVITTKSGKARKGIGVEVNYSHEWGTIYKNSVPLQNEYGMGLPSNGYEGDVIPGTNSTRSDYVGASWGPSFESMAGQQMYQYYKYYTPDGTDNPLDDYVAYSDNWKTMYQNSNYDNITVALTGGSEKATYRLSYGYMNGDGNMKKNNFSRHSINFTTNGKINDVFSTNLNIQYSNSNTQNPNSEAHTYGMITNYYVNRNTDIAWYRDHYIDSESNTIVGGSSNQYLSQLNSLLQRQYEDNVNRNEQTIITQLGLNAQFTDWLDASVSLTYNNWQIFTETKNAGYVKQGKYAISGSTSSSYDGTAQIHGNKRFLDDNLGLDVRIFSQLYGNAVGASYSKSTKDGLIVPGVFTFANSASPITQSEMGVNKSNRNSMTLGVGGAVNLDWKDQVFLEVTARNDWLSSLLYPTWIWQGQNNYSVFYPSVNASWVFSDTFQINSDVLSFGKLRASWAQVGMGTDAYATASGAGGFSVGTMYGPTNSALTTASFNNGTLPNYDLKPEIQTSIEFGADLRFLNGAIGVDVAYYKTNTRNQILSLSAVSESGVSSQLINAGNIQNQGWEVQLDFAPIRTRTVTWNIGANWSRNRGKIKELANNIDYYTIAAYSWDGSMTPGIYAFEGGDYGVICSGNGYGISYSPAIARYYNADDPNDYRNGMKLIKVAGSYGESTIPGTSVPTNMVYDYVSAESITGYYGDNASYWGGQSNRTTILGSVEPDFDFGFNTNVMINLPNNSGSIDFYAQIDGRSGGEMVIGNKYYYDGMGNGEWTLYGRDKEHGGIARVNWKGETVYNGIILDDCVFYSNSKVTSLKTGEEVDLAGMTFREAYEAGHIQPVLSSVWQYYASGYADQQISKQSYVALRELTLGYNFPEKWIKHVGLQSARLAFTARNLCYIYNGTSIGVNPDGNLSNNSLTPYNYGTTPFVRNFSFSLNLRF